MIICVIYAGECPDETVLRQAGGHRRILKNINIIIKIDELMMTRLAEDNPDRQSKRGANSPGHPSGACGRLNWSTIADAELIPKLDPVVFQEKRRTGILPVSIFHRQRIFKFQDAKHTIGKSEPSVSSGIVIRPTC